MAAPHVKIIIKNEVESSLNVLSHFSSAHSYYCNTSDRPLEEYCPSLDSHYYVSEISANSEDEYVEEEAELDQNVMFEVHPDVDIEEAVMSQLIVLEGVEINLDSNIDELKGNKTNSATFTVKNGFNHALSDASGYNVLVVCFPKDFEVDPLIATGYFETIGEGLFITPKGHAFFALIPIMDEFNCSVIRDELNGEFGPIFKLILEKLHNCSCTEPSDIVKLCHGIRFGDLSLVDEILISSEFDKRHPGPMYDAVKEGPEMLKRILSNGWNPNVASVISSYDVNERGGFTVDQIMCEGDSLKLLLQFGLEIPNHGPHTDLYFRFATAEQLSRSIPNNWWSQSDLERLFEMRSDVSVDAFNKDGDTAILSAVKKGDPMKSYFASKGANVNLQDRDGNTIGHYGYYVEHSQDMEIRNKLGNTILLERLRKEETLAKCRKLVGLGCDINTVNHNNQSALWMATNSINNLEMPSTVGFLLSLSDKHLNTVDTEFYRSPLDNAIIRNLSVCNCLLSAGANLNIMKPGMTSTALHVAATNQAIIWRLFDIFKSLRGSFDLNPVDSSGDTPLLTACRKGLTESVCVLLYYGADHTVTDSANLTAIEVAEASGPQSYDHSVIIDLLQRAAEPKKQKPSFFKQFASVFK